jgi:hypothetical protein
MSALLESLSSKLSGEILDAEISRTEIARFEQQFRRKLPSELAELLLTANGLVFEPPASFRGEEVTSFLSLCGIENTLTHIGEFVPHFIVPFAQSSGILYCIENGSDPIVYTVTGVGEQMPRIVIDPTYLTLRMFVEELK